MACFFEKTKNVLQLLTLFKKIDESGYQPNRIWVYKGSEFYNKSIFIYIWVFSFTNIHGSQDSRRRGRLFL